MIKAGIIGATGYAGAELARLIMQHPDAELTGCTSRSYAGQRYADIYKNCNSFTVNSGVSLRESKSEKSTESKVNAPEFQI